MEKKNILITLSSVILVVMVFIIINNWKMDNDETTSKTNTNNEIDKYDENTIYEIKNEINATANTNMYQIEEEYDGRKILQIKPSIQYQTVLAGILKNGQPAEDEIQKLLENKPNKTGVWISKNSREKFLNLLKENGITTGNINQEGYLEEIQDEHIPEAKKLNTLLTSTKLYIIDICGTSYIRDEFSGEIVAYPFEKMDPYQIVDVYQEAESMVLEITTNENQKYSNQEILNEILLNME